MWNTQRPNASASSASAHTLLLEPIVERASKQFIPAPPSAALAAIDQLSTPCLYAHPGTLRLLAVNAAAANDLGRSKNELTRLTLRELLALADGLPMQTATEPGAQVVLLSSQCCKDWQRAHIAPVGNGVSHFLRVTIDRYADAPPTDRRASSHDSFAGDLVAHGLALLQESGSRQFSVRSVARRAGVGLGHLQHYFRPKIRLQQAMADAITFELLYHYERWVAPLPKPRARLIAVIEFALDQRQHGDWLAVIRAFREMARDDPELRPLLSSLFQECHRLFRHLFASINPQLQGDALTTTVNQALSLLSESDHFVHESEGAIPSYRAHLTARILQLVHSDRSASAAKAPAPPKGVAANAPPAAAEQIAQLLDLSDTLVRVADGEERLQHLCEAARHLLGADQISLFLGDDRRWRGRVHSAREPDSHFQRYVMSRSGALAGRTLAGRGCVLHEAMPSSTGGLPATDAAIALFGPNDQPCGLLIARYHVAQPQLSALDHQLLTGLATLCETIVQAEPSLLE